MKAASKSVSKKAKPSAPSARLTRDDWLDAAFACAVESGFDAVRVLTLAQRLGVTRGSFYWHFTAHAELVEALLTRWREREIDAQKIQHADALPDSKADLERLLDAALAYAGEDLQNMRFELALRGLGRRDAKVAKLMLEIDQLRMQLFESKFLRLTQDASTATELATLFYLAIIGSSQALSRPSNPPRLKEYLRRIIGKHLIARQ